MDSLARCRTSLPAFLVLLICTALPAVVSAQELPYLVTYSDVLEEPGNLELGTQNVYATPKDANPFYAQTFEVEYGVAAWWTTEIYLQGQVTAHDSNLFTGVRFENRFRPLRQSHRVNPVLYLEYEDINRADKSFLEITGNHVISDQQVANKLLRTQVERAFEGKLILSSYVKGVNLSENFIAEKNISNEPWGFGYTLGASRPLVSTSSESPCRFCPKGVSLGGELFGGLGTRYTFGFKSTSIYAGPTVGYSASHNMTVFAGPEFGLNANSATVLWKFKAMYEFNQVRDLFRRAR